MGRAEPFPLVGDTPWKHARQDGAPDRWTNGLDGRATLEGASTWGWLRRRRGDARRQHARTISPFVVLFRVLSVFPCDRTSRRRGTGSAGRQLLSKRRSVEDPGLACAVSRENDHRVRSQRRSGRSPHRLKPNRSASYRFFVSSESYSVLVQARRRLALLDKCKDGQGRQALALIGTRVRLVTASIQLYDTAGNPSSTSAWAMAVRAALLLPSARAERAAQGRTLFLKLSTRWPNSEGL